jgi:hypothetical protein
MREMVMHWRRGGINRLLLYLDDFRFTAHGFWQCARLVRKVRADFVRAKLRINVPMCHTSPAKQRMETSVV